MVLWDILLIVIFALILSSILTWGFGWRHPATEDAAFGSLLFVFLLIVFATWAAGLWFPTWRAGFYGASWLGLLVFSIFVALLVMALAAPADSRRTLGNHPITDRPITDRPLTDDGNDAATTAFGAFFWVLMIGLLLAIVIGYAVR